MVTAVTSIIILVIVEGIDSGRLRPGQDSVGVYAWVHYGTRGKSFTPLTPTFYLHPRFQ